MITAEITETAINLYSDRYVGNIPMGKIGIQYKNGRYKIAIYPPNGYEPTYILADKIEKFEPISLLDEKLKAYEGEEAKIAKRDREGNKVE